jgi:hypothetical protein
MKSISIIVVLLCLLLPQTLFAGQKSIGNIKNLTGEVKIIQNSKEFVPVPGTELFSKDTLKTGSDGTVGIILLDNTIFSLGHDSELKLDVFHFDPPNKSFSLVTRMIKGTFIFISGLIGKISPESVELLTPDGSVTIRGTKLAIQVKEDK